MTSLHSIKEAQTLSTRSKLAVPTQKFGPAALAGALADEANSDGVRNDALLYDIELPERPQVRATQIILSQYRTSPNLLAYIDALMEEVDELTTALIATYVYRYSVLAYGNMLDTIAEIVGVQREITGAAPLGLFGWYEDPTGLGHNDALDPTSSGGRLLSFGEQVLGDLQLTDEELRRYILARIIVNCLRPTVNNMYAYTDLLFGSVDPRWELQEAYSTDANASPAVNMHFHGYFNVQERAFFSAVYLRFKVSGVKVTLSDDSGDIELLQP